MKEPVFELCDKNTHRVSLGVVLVLLAVGFGAGRALGIDSAGSGFWTNGSTWVGGVVPGAADTAVILNGHTITNSATFIANTNSTVLFASTNEATVAGSNTFYNLTCTNAGKTVRFTAGTTNWVNGRLALGSGKTSCGEMLNARHDPQHRRAVEAMKAIYYEVFGSGQRHPAEVLKAAADA